MSFNYISASVVICSKIALLHLLNILGIHLLNVLVIPNEVLILKVYHKQVLIRPLNHAYNRYRSSSVTQVIIMTTIMLRLSMYSGIWHHKQSPAMDDN